MMTLFSYESGIRKLIEILKLKLKLLSCNNLRLVDYVKRGALLAYF